MCPALPVTPLAHTLGPPPPNCSLQSTHLSTFTVLFLVFVCDFFFSWNILTPLCLVNSYSSFKTHLSRSFPWSQLPLMVGWLKWLVFLSVPLDYKFFRDSLPASEQVGSLSLNMFKTGLLTRPLHWGCATCYLCPFRVIAVFQLLKPKTLESYSLSYSIWVLLEILLMLPSEQIEGPITS